MKNYKSIFIILIILIFVGGANSKLHGQQLNSSLNFEYGKIEIPFIYNNGFIELEIELNDLPLRFIYDTGSEHTFLSKAGIGTALDLQVIKEIEVYGADFSRTLTAFITKPVKIELNEMFIKDEPILILSEDIFCFDINIESEIDGIIGASFFKNLIVKINYRRGLITIYPPEADHYTQGFVEVPADFKGYKPIIKSYTSVHHSDSTKLANILLDTGCAVPLILFKNVDSGVNLPDKIVRGHLGKGLGGNIMGWKGLIERLNIGEFSFHSLICRFQDIDSVNMERTSLIRNGILGNEILKRFTVIIDNLDKKLYFQPNKLYYKKIKYDKSGISVYGVGKELNKFYVKYVVPGSPADLAGIKAKDRIISIQNFNTSFWTVEGVNRLFKKKEDKKVRLKIQRNEKKYIYKFMLRDMFM